MTIIRNYNLPDICILYQPCAVGKPSRGFWARDVMLLRVVKLTSLISLVLDCYTFYGTSWLYSDF